MRAHSTAQGKRITKQLAERRKITHEWPQNGAETEESEEVAQKVKEKNEPKEKNGPSRTVCFVDWQLHVCRCAVVE